LPKQLNNNELKVLKKSLANKIFNYRLGGKEPIQIKFVKFKNQNLIFKKKGISWKKFEFSWPQFVQEIKGDYISARRMIKFSRLTSNPVMRVGFVVLAVFLLSYFLLPALRNTKFQSEASMAVEPPPVNSEYNYLMVGVDESEYEDNRDSRADALILVNVRPYEKSIHVVAIPRDSFVNIPGRVYDSRINNAFAFGGIDLQIKTVEAFMEVPVDGYALTNFESFKKAYDTIKHFLSSEEASAEDVSLHVDSGSPDAEFDESLTGDEALRQMRNREFRDAAVGRAKNHALFISSMIRRLLPFYKKSSFISKQAYNALTLIVKTDVAYSQIDDIGKVLTNLGEDETISISTYYVTGEPNDWRPGDPGPSYWIPIQKPEDYSQRYFTFITQSPDSTIGEITYS